MAQQDTAAVDTATLVPFIANWEVGDSLRFAVSEIEVKYVGDSTVTNDTVRYEADFLVVDSTEAGYLINWEKEENFNSFTKDFLAQIGMDMIDALEDMGEGVPQFRTTPYGQYMGIANAGEIKQLLDLIMEPMVDYMLESGELGVQLDSPQEIELRKLMDARLAELMQPASLQQEFLPVIPSLLFPMGAQYYLYDTIRRPVEVPSAIPGETITQHWEMYFDEHKPEFSYIHMKLFTEVERASGLRVITERLRQKKLPEEQLKMVAEEAIYREREDNDYYYFYGAGVPDYIDCFREVIFQAPGEAKTTSITQFIIEFLGPFDK